VPDAALATTASFSTAEKEKTLQLKTGFYICLPVCESGGRKKESKSKSAYVCVLLSALPCCLV